MVWLAKALEINPFLQPALINMAGYYQDDGYLAEARSCIDRAASEETLARTAPHGWSPAAILRLRRALMLSPVSESWPMMWRERAGIVAALDVLLDDVAAAMAREGDAYQRAEVGTSLDRIHFYISYHGLNDRYLQERIMEAYRAVILLEYISPQVGSLANADLMRRVVGSDLQNMGHTADSTNVGRVGGLDASTFTFQQLLLLLQQQQQQSPVAPLQSINPPPATLRFKKTKVGFVSKFFGIFEPHGMLLDGVMRYLPRHYFEVVALPVARSDSKPVSPSVQEACGAVIPVSLSFGHAQV
jgi:hypothetical protein